MAAKKKPVDDSLSKRLTPKDNKEKSSHERLKPKDTSSVKKIFWSFGFKYFIQRELFGFSKVDVSWFVSVLERLRDTSKMEYTGMTQVLEDGYRYHEINWNQKNIPLQRKDFSWIDVNYLENETEYPFCQFHISKGTGRIVGFWDECNIFQILLLDPGHNLQPSSFNNYELRECFPAQSQFDSLLFDIENIVKEDCSINSCPTIQKLRMIPNGRNDVNIVLAHLDDDFQTSLAEILKIKTITEILEAGIVSLS